MLFETQKDRVSMRELRDAMAGLLGTEHEAVAHLERLAENRRNPASPTSHLCDPGDGMLLMLACYLSSAGPSAGGQLVDQVISIAGAP